MHRLLCLISLIGICLSLSGCPAVKGYPGPELPDEQLSIIYPRYNSSNMYVGESAMNGIEFGSSGIKVLPGDQDFEMAIVAKEPPFHCYAYPDFNYYGYNDCQKKAAKNYKYCDCWDYLSVYKNCSRYVRDGTCRGNMKTRANSQYDITPIKYENRIQLGIIERGTNRSSGSGSCNLWGEQRVETENSYQGSGRSTAYQNGIYGCYG